MPIMVLNRDANCFVGVGTVTFKKGEPVFVPDYMVPGAIAMGAIPQNEKEAKSVAAAVAVKEAEVEPTGDLRQRQIKAAMTELRALNNSEDYTASGVPNDAAITRTLGYSITRKEREEAWKSLIGSK